MYFWNTNQFILWQILNNVVPITALEIKKYCIATILFEEIKFKGAIDYYIKGWIFFEVLQLWQVWGVTNLINISGASHFHLICLFK